ncbi:D-alanyl-D-alanine carboxypeptidase DacF precursor [Variibacter gotjawalensis]|uniref:D-alanyl-D-alanine carboxypeptidase DacF n=1 Tax=Variibacter gotjawalensis TaxID=1333996 RepID=A0A0S3PY63_9BRAD|nr:D-alanyl-D-alanine carboxypeptidase [Variibacter gotjawalensis]NIK46655.1 D-alanyl-D-alanine carboxypeptidase [Variibacter gotjawalensis]RZS48558.1 D-alanyl-D-alanine carboxypeptidase [Variibacter gotjawalensis]BAT60820.1 D-alanyl-D-alanine carboxypeptidase DacF precursor [Variibacter gotjawalensis]
MRSKKFRTGTRIAVFALAAVVAVVALGSDPADARRRHKKFRAVGYAPAYAAIVVDANTGQVMHDESADQRRHPASLTKIMTLYMLFEQLESGKLRLDSRLPVSSHAASMAPTKLGLRPGQTIEAEDAIKALVTRSANDAAAVIAEAIGGEEEDFARMMTRKARSLGMSRTVYKNASGLPDMEQITTARDQAILGRAIQERFPRYYRYFNTRQFVYRGRPIGNHNRLLGRVEGVDGIKTGYTRASGFNLVSSMKRGNRHIVAVVLGGRSGGARDARMRHLLEDNIVEASARRTAPRMIEVADNDAPAKPQRVAVAEAPRATASVPQTFAMMAPVAAPAPSVGSAEPIRPTLVKTLTVKRGPAAQAAAPAPVAAPQRVASLGDTPIISEPRSPRALPKGEWVIQIGAFPAETQAQERLKEARSLASSALGRAEPFTERVTKGDTTLFRARFAGFDRDRAEAACKQLKRSEINCLAMKN